MRQKRLYADRFDLLAAHAVLLYKPMPKAARNICTARAPRTATNSMRILSFEMDMRKRAPRIAPTTDPKAAGPAIGATILPRTRYAPALAAAVTQIMKFEVADETFIGRRNAVSMAGTLRTPLPIPKSAETRPAQYIRIIPIGSRSTR